MKIQNNFKSLILIVPLLFFGITKAQTGSQSLWGWGSNGSGTLGLGNTIQQNSPKLILDSSEFKSISAGNDHTLVIKKDGTLWAWGSNKNGQLGLGNTNSYNTPQQVGFDSNWVSISAGSAGTLAIKKDGTLWAWGKNNYGQLGLGNNKDFDTPQQVGNDTSWVTISAGYEYPFNWCKERWFSMDLGKK